jgi:hypothetical protein
MLLLLLLLLVWWLRLLPLLHRQCRRMVAPLCWPPLPLLVLCLAALRLRPPRLHR